jgi:hypothetical protein
VPEKGKREERVKATHTLDGDLAYAIFIKMTDLSVGESPGKFKKNLRASFHGLT